MDSIYNRENTLRERLNGFFITHLGLPDTDYFGSMKPESFLVLKSVLSDINNLVTLKVSLSFVDWVSHRLRLSQSARLELINEITSTKPNTNGFDIYLGYPIAFVAEVKCNVPINLGTKYGSAQRNGIDKDITALLEGKTKASMLPNGCFKFMVFLDTPEIRSATKHYVATNKVHGSKILFADESTGIERVDIVYIVFVKLDTLDARIAE